MINDCKDIAFIISSLKAGGAERVIATMANYWAKKDMNITIYTLDKGDSFYKLHSNITLRQMNLYKKSANKLLGILNNLKRIKKIKKELLKGKHNVIISFGTRANILVLMALMYSRIPVIVSERTYPSKANIGGIHWSFLRSIAYLRANKVIVQTNAGREYFKNIIRKKALIIPNPVNIDINNTLNIDKKTEESKMLLAMGRFVYEKGFDLLIKAFALIKDQNPAWKLEIWGEGEERKNLEKIISDFKLGETVELPGITKEPSLKMMEADLFVLSSRREGFPNVLCEAMVVGLPVVATDCLSGPRDIISDGVDGIIVEAENVEELAVNIHRLMKDEDKRVYLGSNAKKSIQRFQINKVMKLWEETIEEAVN